MVGKRELEGERLGATRPALKSMPYGKQNEIPVAQLSEDQEERNFLH